MRVQSVSMQMPGLPLCQSMQISSLTCIGLRRSTVRRRRARRLRVSILLPRSSIASSAPSVARAQALAAVYRRQVRGIDVLEQLCFVVGAQDVDLRNGLRFHDSFEHRECRAETPWRVEDEEDVPVNPEEAEKLRL